jgi:hypothetical protein
VSFSSDHSSNVNGAVRLLCGDEWGHQIDFDTPMPVRRFNAMTKDWPYFGCTGKEMVKNIRKAFKNSNH